MNFPRNGMLGKLPGSGPFGFEGSYRKPRLCRPNPIPVIIAAILGRLSQESGLWI
jgi:hypothetical protein